MDILWSDECPECGAEMKKLEHSCMSKYVIKYFMCGSCEGRCDGEIKYFYQSEKCEIQAANQKNSGLQKRLKQAEQIINVAKNVVDMEKTLVSGGAPPVCKSMLDIAKQELAWLLKNYEESSV